MGAPSISMLPRSPRRRLRHRPITSTGAELRLAALAAAIMRLHEEGRCPAGWRVEPFGREVSAVLGQLVPIRSAATLASSYAREGRRLSTVPPAPSTAAVDVTHPDVGDAIDVAYALRWLELGEVPAG
jgi:hypothetical protein